MKWYFVYRRDHLVVCYVYFLSLFRNFLISFKYNFHIDAEIITVKPQEM